VCIIPELLFVYQDRERKTVEETACGRGGTIARMLKLRAPGGHIFGATENL
jgi:hypothetical protein